MSKIKKATDHPGRFAYEGLDRTIHEKARLGIVTSLATHPQRPPNEGNDSVPTSFSLKARRTSDILDL